MRAVGHLGVQGVLGVQALGFKAEGSWSRVLGRRALPRGPIVVPV